MRGADVFFQALFGFEGAAAGIGAGPVGDVVEGAGVEGTADEGLGVLVDGFDVCGEVCAAGESLVVADVVGTGEKLSVGGRIRVLVGM